MSIQTSSANPSPIYPQNANSDSGSGGNFQCQPGHYINKISWQTTKWEDLWVITALVVTSSDGTTSPTFGSWGGTSGGCSVTAIANGQGFNSATIGTGTIVMSLSFGQFDGSGESQTCGGSSYNNMYQWTAPPGMCIVGINVVCRVILSSIQFMANYPVDCTVPANSISSVCSLWCNANNAECLNNLNTVITTSGTTADAITMCQQKNINCDSAMTTYCDVSTNPNAINNPNCACWYGNSWFNNYLSSLDGQVSGVASIVTGQTPVCYFSPCSVSQILPYNFKNGEAPCPPYDIVQCIGNVNFTNSGTIDGNVQISTSQNCQQYNNLGGSPAPAGTASSSGKMTIFGKTFSKTTVIMCVIVLVILLMCLCMVIVGGGAFFLL